MKNAIRNLVHYARFSHIGSQIINNIMLLNNHIASKLGSREYTGCQQSNLDLF